MLLIRHAHAAGTDTSLAGRAANVALSPLGQQQLTTLRAAVRDISIAAIYSSPLERARQTANAVAAEHSLAVEAYDELIEVDFGEWTGRTFQELEELAAWRMYNRSRSTTQIPGGEHPSAVARRATRALEALHRRHPGETIAVVSHAEIIRSAVLRYLGYSLDLYHELEIPPASITKIAFTTNGPTVVAVGMKRANSSAGL
jgi:probable phosphoglycerate mutase